MAFIVHSSRIYQYRSKNHWKETWLSLTQDGTLNWKRKDAYFALASLKILDVIDFIKIGDAWRENEKHKIRPFFIYIPIHRNGSKFAFLNGPDLELWLNAFASVIGLKLLYDVIKRKHALRIAEKRFTTEDAVESVLDYKNLVLFYKAIWEDFMRNRHHDVKMIEELAFDIRKSFTDDNTQQNGDCNCNVFECQSLKKEENDIFEYQSNDTNGHTGISNGETNSDSSLYDLKDVHRKNGYTTFDESKDIYRANLIFCEPQETKSLNNNYDKHLTIIYIDHENCMKNGECVVHF